MRTHATPSDVARLQRDQEVLANTNRAVMAVAVVVVQALLGVLKVIKVVVMAIVLALIELLSKVNSTSHITINGNGSSGNRSGSISNSRKGKGNDGSRRADIKE